jgi:hypothetical protein
MEHFNLLPVNSWKTGQGLEKFELSGAGRRDQSR